MKLKLAIRNSIVLALALTTFVQIDPVSLVTEGSVSSQAMAKVGRPLHPEAQRVLRGARPGGSSAERTFT